MFSLSSLVGGGAKVPTQLEFTPIGKRSTRRGMANVDQEETPTTQNTRLDRDNIVSDGGQLHYDSTPARFDSTFSLDGAEEYGGGPGSNQRVTNDAKVPQRQIINDGVSSIQSVQNEIKELLNENYNLKVEVATLQQYLKLSPLETRDIALENSKLKQELIMLRRRLDESQYSIDNDSAGVADRSVLQEKEREINSLRNSLEELSRELSTQKKNNKSVPDEIIEKLEFLENENQALRRKVQDAAAGRLAVDVGRENELSTELHRLKSKLAALPPNVEEQVESLVSENELLNRKLKLALDDVNQLQNERDSFEDQLSLLQQQLEKKSQEIARLRLDLSNHSTSDLALNDIQLELKASRREVEEMASKLNSSRKEISELKSKSTGSQRSYRQMVEELEAKVQSLQNKLNAVNETLREKDHDNFELKAEIKSLMTERISEFDNQSTIRHYQSQIDKLRQKEDAMSEEVSSLRSQLADEKANKTVISERDHRLSQEIQELQDKLDYYEEQYGLLEDSKTLAENEVELLEAKIKKADDQLKLADMERRGHEEEAFRLEKEIEVLQAKLRRSEINDAHKYNELALLELEELHKKREEADKIRMNAQVDLLKEEVKRLEWELQKAKEPSARASYESREYAKDSPRDSFKLRTKLEDVEDELRDQVSKTTRLLNNIKDKDSVIDALESRIRELNRELKATINTSDDKWSEISKLESEHQNQLRNIRLEHEREVRNVLLESERLERNLRDEIRYYKTQVDTLKDKGEYQQSESNSAMVALLEIQLEQLKSTNKELSNKLLRVQLSNQSTLSDLAESHKLEIQKLQRMVENSESQLQSLELEYKSALEQKETYRKEANLLKSQQHNTETDWVDLKAKNESLKNQFTKLEQIYESMSHQRKSLQDEIVSLQSEINDLKARNDTLKRRLDREQKSHSNAESLKTEVELLNSEKTRLELKANNLSEELKRTTTENTQLASELKKMEVEKFKKSIEEEEDEINDRFAAALLSTESEKQHSVREAELRSLKNKVIYNKAISWEVLSRYNDLKTINALAGGLLQGFFSGYRTNLQDGSERYQKGKPRITIKTISKVVYAATMMKNLGRKRRRRIEALEQLQEEIARDQVIIKLGRH